MSGLPTLRVRESLHIQKIEEFKAIVAELKPQSLLIKNMDLNIKKEDIETLNNDIELLINTQKILKEESLLNRVQLKIKSIQRDKNRRDRINNLTVNVQPPNYDDIVHDMERQHLN